MLYYINACVCVCVALTLYIYNNSLDCSVECVRPYYLQMYLLITNMCIAIFRFFVFIFKMTKTQIPPLCLCFRFSLWEKKKYPVHPCLINPLCYNS